MSFFNWMHKYHSRTSLFKEIDNDMSFPWDRSMDDMISHVDYNLRQQLEIKQEEYIDDIYDGFNVKMTCMELC